MRHFLAGVILKKYNLLREGHFMAILWHKSSAGGVQGWTDFVWSWKIGSGLARIVWTWKIGWGLVQIVWSWTIGIFGSSAIFLPQKICSGQACHVGWLSRYWASTAALPESLRLRPLAISQSGLAIGSQPSFPNYVYRAKINQIRAFPKQVLWKKQSKKKSIST